MKDRKRGIVIGGLAVVFGAGVARGAPGRPGAQGGRAGPVELGLSVAPLIQFATDVDGGGEISASSLLLRGDVSCRWGRSVGGSAGFHVRQHDYRFSGPVPLGSGKPWGETLEIGTGVRVRWGLTPEVQFTGGLRAAFAGEPGAETGDALTGGVLVGVAYARSRALVLGVGGGMSAGLEETRVFPYLMMRWQISQRWFLGNPSPGGPTGPAGLELTWRPADAWTVAWGAAYRGQRFRLDRRSEPPGGIGEWEAIPAWLRFSRSFGAALRGDAYAGALLNGSVSLEDPEGRKLNDVDFDPVPFLALRLGVRY